MIINIKVTVDADENLNVDLDDVLICAVQCAVWSSLKQMRIEEQLSFVSLLQPFLKP